MYINMTLTLFVNSDKEKTIIFLYFGWNVCKEKFGSMESLAIILYENKKEY